MDASHRQTAVNTAAVAYGQKVIEKLVNGLHTASALALPLSYEFLLVFEKKRIG
jgi:hypothetical protein